MSWVSKEGKIIFLNRGIRSFGYGFISVILGIYFSDLGFQAAQIGLLLSAAIIGGAVFTILMGRHSAEQGLKRMLILSTSMAVAGIAVFLLTDNFLFLLAASFIGFISPSGRELGPFLSLEQAYIPFTVSDKDRTKAFSFWNITATLSASFGALMGSLPLFLMQLGMERTSSFKLMFLGYLLLNAIALMTYTQLKEVRFEEKKVALSKKSRDAITKLSLLFALDSIGGGLVITSILSLWFYSKFDVPLTDLSALFFAAGLLEAVSYYFSRKLAEKIGLINTMVFTHTPSSIFLILIPFMPSFTLAALMYLLRQLLSEMDVPVRQSYVVAIVKPEETAIASSTTNVAKIIAQSLGPSLASILLATPLSPFVVAGVLKIAYDVSIYFGFRKLKPPEEQNR